MSLPSGKKIYFASDLHLGASYIADGHAHEREIVRWLRSIADDAAMLFLVGDVLDYWYEYRTVVPRGYVRFLGALAELADKGVKVVWLKGNHDIWIYDYLPSELGVSVVDGSLDIELLGKRFFIEHGDASGENRPGYRRLRALFRNRLAQSLFAAIHPRWTVPFAHRWSSHSRSTGMEATSLPDDHRLIEFAKSYSEEHGHVDFFVFGHLHVAVDRDVAPQCRLVVLGDGYRLMTYGVFDGISFRLLRMADGQAV